MGTARPPACPAARPSVVFWVALNRSFRCSSNRGTGFPSLCFCEVCCRALLVPGGRARTAPSQRHCPPPPSYPRRDTALALFDCVLVGVALFPSLPAKRKKERKTGEQRQDLPCGGRCRPTSTRCSAPLSPARLFYTVGSSSIQDLPPAVVRPSVPEPDPRSLPPLLQSYCHRAPAHSTLHTPLSSGDRSPASGSIQVARAAARL
ncbi:hypothetical protein BS78_01G269600 [Paspalum vaginatum]|nr:hypothetical protein BS78_01G269600 [Paspalum vaginatum]